MKNSETFLFGFLAYVAGLHTWEAFQEAGHPVVAWILLTWIILGTFVIILNIDRRLRENKKKCPDQIT